MLIPIEKLLLIKWKIATDEPKYLRISGNDGEIRSFRMCPAMKQRIIVMNVKNVGLLILGMTFNY